MWQRTQSLFFCLTILFNAAIFWLNLAIVRVGEDAYNFNLYKLQSTDGEVLVSTLLLAILCSACILMSGIAFSMFKKRQMQIKIAQFLLLLQVGFLVAIFFTVDNTITGLARFDNSIVEYGVGAYLALIPLVFIFLAMKGIKKDEALVRAADRIR